MEINIVYVFLGIQLITIRNALGYLDIAVSKQETEKGDNITIIATTSDESVSWTFNDSRLASCSITDSECFPNPLNNMVFTANFSLGTSTIQITKLNCSINSGRLVATTPSSETKETTINVYTPASIIIWKTNVQSYPVDSATIIVEIPCVYRVKDIEVNFTVIIEGQSDIILPADSVTESSGTGCECSERTLEATKTISYPNKVAQVQAQIFHKSLPSKAPKVEKLSENITFSSGPTTNTARQTTTQLHTVDTTFNLTEIQTTNTDRSSTAASWLSENKYYIGGAFGGAVVLLVSIIGVCCFYTKRKYTNNVSENKF